ncbi:MAG: 4'-phosphopantetheinyl transferase superfamily protein [Chitinophagaceae bacterium]|nr:4'-phosphopantetheinyl transferase superfamily protein [Chitinophagaceae bacterium]
MPLFKEWNPNLHSLAAIWHITEQEEFFANHVLLSSQHINSAKRRIEFLAGRFLLRQLHKDFPLHSIITDDQDKPQLPNKTLHFSISHSYPYVACIISTQSSVGIDIQCWHKSILALQQKFLSPNEQQYCANDPKKITVAWCSKEAAYKYQGSRGVDFIKHLPITHWQEANDQFDISIKLTLIKPAEHLGLKSFVFEHFALSIASA